MDGVLDLGDDEHAGWALPGKVTSGRGTKQTTLECLLSSSSLLTEICSRSRMSHTARVALQFGVDPKI